ncbi:MAG: hypothetical protein ACRDO7_13160 [Nocardioidaceae bacterium]
MVRVVGGVVTSALLVLGLVSCTSASDPDTTIDASENVAVEPDEVVRHEAASGTPISFGIDVPDGAVQVGPLIRQRRLEVEEVIEDPGGRADAFGNEETDGEEPDPATHDPEEPAPPDFTTALLRVDDDPSEVLQNTLEEIEDALPDSEIDPEKWADHCTVENGVYTGCEAEFSGKTEDDQHIAVEMTVYPGRPKSKVAPAGSLLRPVMALTIEQQAPPTADEEGDGESPGEDGPSTEPGKNDRPGDTTTRNESDSPRTDKRRPGRADDPRRDRDGRDRDPRDKNPSADGGPPGREEQDSDQDSPDGPPTWPTMNKERPAQPGDWILTPRWKVHRNTEVILSTRSPKIALLAVKDGADADAIARRYVRAFADEATTPKIDEVEDRNERSITYTPRNDGTGPSVAVTAVATGRGNYIELLFSPDPTDAGEPVGNGPERGDRSGKKGKPGHRKAAKRTSSSTG